METLQDQKKQIVAVAAMLQLKTGSVAAEPELENSENHRILESFLQQIDCHNIRVWS